METVKLASRIIFSTLRFILRRLKNLNVYLLVYIYLVFLRIIVSVE